MDVVEGHCRVKQALIRDKRNPSLYLLPSAQTRDKTAVSPEQMIKMVTHLREQFDYIILDCPAGIEQGFQNICHRVLGKEVPFPDYSKSISFWTRVTGIFHRV